MKKVWSVLILLLCAAATFFLTLVILGRNSINIFTVPIIVPVAFLLIAFSIMLIKKQFKRILVSVFVMVITVAIVFAMAFIIDGYIGSDNNFNYYKNEDGTVRVDLMEMHESDDIVVPEEYNGKTVTEIYWYNNIFDVSVINTFTIPSTIEKIVIPSVATDGRPTVNINSLYYEGTLAQWCSIEFAGSVLGDVDKLYIDGVLIEGDLAIPAEVNKINNYAFYYCSSLTSVVIPDSVTSIGDYAFFGCSSLTDVYYTGTEEEWGAINIGSGNSYLTDATIHFNYVPEE